MVIASHVILSAYGFWLPNDPRGSWSDFVRSWELFRFGKATKTDQRRSLAWDEHDRHRRLAAKKALKYPPVKFTGAQARAVGRGFGERVESSGLSVLACSILPDHVHMVVRRHSYHIEQIVNLLKGAATRRLVAEEIHPFARHARSDGRPPPMWAKGQWKVFLNNAADIERAIRYVEGNPMREGLPRQRWSFVTTVTQ